MKKFIISISLILFSAFVCCTSALAVYYGPTWNKESISVYIPKDNKYASDMKRAFVRWQKGVDGKIKFVFIDNSDEADVVVNFTDEVDGTDGEVASYQTTIRNGAVTNAQINLATEGEKKFSQQLVYKTMLHEVGHVLGLPDSNKNLGIMHFPVNEKQEIITNDFVKLYRYNNWRTINGKINIVKD